MWYIPRKNAVPFAVTSKKGCQTVYKPGSVQRPKPLVRPFIWDGGCPTPLATYPDTPTHKRAVTVANQSNMVSLFGLAPDGACHALFLAVEAVGSYPTVSPLPMTSMGGLFSVALSLKPCMTPRPRRALPAIMFAWSPDFPPLRPFGDCKRGRPTV